MLASQQVSIIRTERGLTIEGTRITLYDVMDYWTEYPVRFISGLFDLTEAQVSGAIEYIQDHRDAVEAEYQQVLKEAEELQQYYEVQNRDRIARIAAMPPKPGQEALYAKLNAEKARFGL
jgi:uncharacterized protein (DUF433 family)